MRNDITIEAPQDTLNTADLILETITSSHASEIVCYVSIVTFHT